MVFNSVIFLIVFLPTVIGGYYLLPKRFRNIWLLASSLLFFAWGRPQHMTPLLTSILINFHTGLFIERHQKNKKVKRTSLGLGIAANLSLLFYYKYFTFALLNINLLFSANLAIPDVMLPIGISFFTFQGMSYIIDAYRGTAPVNRRLTDVALYISMFPQLLAGPIVRYKDIAGQLHHRQSTATFVAEGIDRFIIGLAKKILIADVLGATASRIFTAFPLEVDTPSVWLAVVCNTFQIYFDFSSYSDMAIGLGKMIGFTIGENFRYPYIATSITDFWKRWHISLSVWFKNYVYAPLSGGLVKKKWNMFPIYLVSSLVVWFLTGLWHGAQWQFILWGFWHGGFLIAERALNRRALLERVPRGIRWAITMFIVTMGWVAFNSKGMRDALQIYQALFGKQTAEFVTFSFQYYLNRRVVTTLLVAAIAATPLLASVGKRLKNRAVFQGVKRVALLVLLAVCILNTVSGSYSPFIYFKF